ncbi:MAG: VWA domain-containing protein [Rhodothermia bacterium]|nr:VWA domain-containing protein [Rhodothermia bacterium]
MEWDQFIFKKIHQLVTFVRSEKPDPERMARAVTLEEMAPRLTSLARLLCGKAITLHPSEDVGGFKGTSFFLPRQYDHGHSREANEAFYLFRTLFLYGQFILRQAWTDHNNHTHEESVSKAREQAQAVLQFLSKEFETFPDVYRSVLHQETAFQQSRKKTGIAESPTDVSLVYGKWLYLNPDELEALEALKGVVNRNTVAEDKDKNEFTEHQAPAKEETEVLKVDTREQENYTLTHNFEKIETLDEFSGRWRNFDGSDDMEEHSEALRDLDLRHLVRVDNPVHSIYKSEFVNSLGLIEIHSPEQQAFYLQYDEWDRNKKQYKAGFCKVYPAFIKEKKPHYTQKIIRENQGHIRQMLKHAERFLTDYHVKKRLIWGDEPDLDATVEAFVDRWCGIAPNENLYVAKRKRTKEIAILVLTDVSLSTDGYSNNKRILDTEKEALVMVSEVWRQLGVRFQLDTFSSRTHNHCYYHTAKAFHQSWEDSRDHIGAIESSGYTRIGPAIRHATYLLEQVRADTKWLLLLTDGKPNDYDTYEGQYGIFDTQKAINEAREKQMHASAIAIDETAKFYLPQIFGRGGYQILRHANQLPDALLNCYLNIL